MNRVLLLIIAILSLVAGCKEDSEPPVVESGSPPANFVHAIYITPDGVKYFATKSGLASFDGNTWVSYHENPGITSKEINDIDFEISENGPEFWLGTNQGLTVAEYPVDAISGATNYTKENTEILFPGQEGLPGDSVFVVTVDKNDFRWFGTENGISVFRNNEWPAINRQNFYASSFFVNNRITSIDYSNDTVYIGTLGGGVARMVANVVDAVTAASPYVIPWSLVASENILDVYIDGNTQWFGTDSGVSKHTGTLSKQNWETYTEVDGLVNNYVQSIVKDQQNNMWFGTKNGLSGYDGEQWKNYTESDGLAGNNVLCLAVDLDGSLWIGTDNGISHFDGTTWTTYRAE